MVVCAAGELEVLRAFIASASACISHGLLLSTAAPGIGTVHPYSFSAIAKAKWEGSHREDIRSLICIPNHNIQLFSSSDKRTNSVWLCPPWQDLGFQSRTVVAVMWGQRVLWHPTTIGVACRWGLHWGLSCAIITHLGPPDNLHCVSRICCQCLSLCLQRPHAFLHRECLGRQVLHLMASSWEVEFSIFWGGSIEPQNWGEGSSQRAVSTPAPTPCS